jgi:transposase-like protein
MLQRIRLAMQDDDNGGKLRGAVEVDETFIGGKARNMHHAKRERLIKGAGHAMIGKVAVMGLLQRKTANQDSTVRLEVVPNVRGHRLQGKVREEVERNSMIFSDALKSYRGLSRDYVHQVIDHADAYVDGMVHTNGLENFWSLLKRALTGTYVSIEPFHLFRYLDEQTFRFNGRKLSDAERFSLVVNGIVGRRLTYQDLIGPLNSGAPA